MMEYLKRKLSKIGNQDFDDQIGYPRYYEENGLLIRENEDGTKAVVTIESDGRKILVKEIK